MKRLLLSLLWLIPAGLFAQITIDESLTTQQLVEDVLIGGSCAETSNFVSSTGTDFGNVNGIAAFNANGSDFPFQSGIVLSSGAAGDAPGPNINDQGAGGWPGDADLEANTSATFTNDASFIQFDFTPLNQDLSFNFIMASEEYDQNFECIFSDAFAFILTDLTTGVSENLAVLPGTTIPIEVTNIRPEVPGLCPAVNEEFFDRYNFQPFNDENTAATNFNGQTVPLTAMATVIIGNPYNIKLVVADETDSFFDIAVFLEAGSFNIGTTELGDDFLIANGNALCEGSTITLDATDPNADSYTWFLNDIEIPGETMPTLTVSAPGTYTVEVALTDPGDCVITDSVIIEFINESTVNIGDDLMLCDSDLGIFDTGLPQDGTTFIWTLDGTPITGETTPAITVSNAGVYEVTVAFTDGCSFSDDAVVTVNPTPTVDLGQDINSCLEDPITLDGTPSDVDPALVAYQWALNGAFIAGETSATLEVTSPGTYEVFVTLDGCTGSDTVVVNLANPDGTSCTLNDLCPDALPLVCGDVVTGNTDGSSSDGAPTEICGTTPGAPGNWYSFIGTGQVIELSLCNSDYDTKIQVYEGTCDALECIGGNDDSCGLQSEFEFLSVAGEEYFFYVFGFNVSTGNYELVVTCVNVPDACIDAPEIACGDTVTGTTAGAPDENIPADLCGLGDGTAGVWFTLSGTNELTTLSLCNSSFDTRINVYTGTCDDLVCFESNDDFCDAQSQVEFISQSGTDYLIYVYGADGESGDFELVVTCEPQPGCIDAAPFCSDDGLIFENVSDGSTAQSGIDYECLITQPNPSWFFLEIEEAGDLSLEIVQNTQFDVDGNPIGTPLDVDFIAWGPFDSVDAGCQNLNPTTSVDCSFSAAPVENFTITNAMVGELYIVLITNFNGAPGFISLGQTGGDGATNCDIVQEFIVDLGEDRIFCSSITPDFEIIPVITGENLGNPTFLWSTGETTETITVATSDTYTLEVTIDGFTVTEEIMITFLDDPCVIEPDCAETAFEENFGTGTTRESTPFTQYIFNGTTQVDDGEYAIINTSAGLNIGWHTTFEDRTPGDVNGRALFVNASFAPDEIYRRTVNGLLMNEAYVFDSWITTVYDTDTNICPGIGIPSNVIFRIEDLNGNILSEVESGDIINEAAVNWQLFSIGFNSGANTSVQIVLINNSIGGCGNDLAIDDITLSFSGTTPDIVNGTAIDLCPIAGSIDLTAQINTILNGEDPAQFQVTYHNTMFDASTGENAIATPEMYSSPGPETIFIRVERLNDTSCFAIATLDLVALNPMVALGPDEILCGNDSFTIVPVTSGNPQDFTYLWSTGETTETITVSGSGTFSVTITTIGGCTATDMINVAIEAPVAINAGEDFITCRNFSSTLNATVDASDVTLQWFLNGDIINGATAASLDFTPGETAFGVQEYTLVATTALGCTSSDTVEVSLYDVGQCVITQGLSPTNGDGLNDSLDLTFLADRTGITNLQIFSRLGRKVFERADYVNQWEGQSDTGGELPTGTYFYVINFDSEDPDFGNQATGWIYLNRE